MNFFSPSDIIYVLIGTIIALLLNNIIQAIFKDIKNDIFNANKHRFK